MWLWVGFCLASAVISENTVLAIEETNSQIPKKTKCEEALLKTWTIFANLLEADGLTVKIPNRNDILYALTLIKKSILNNDESDSDNVYLKERLFLRESELAKYKGVYLNDNRELQTLLDQDLVTNEVQNIKIEYELKTNNNPQCREALKKIIKTASEDYNNLASSSVCIEAPFGVLSSQYNEYIPGYPNQALALKNSVLQSTNMYRDQANNALIPNPQMEVNMVPEAVGQQPDLTPQTNKILHAVKLSKETNHLLGNDYTADLDHAKNVADKINKLYQSNSYDYGLVAQKPLHNPYSNVAVGSAGVLHDPKIDSFYPRPAGMQGSYEAYSNFNADKNINNDRDISQGNAYLYNAPIESTQDNTVNQSYTLMENTMQLQPGFTNTIVKQENTQQLNAFNNPKWYPNPAHYGEAIKEEPPKDSSIPNKRYADLRPNVPNEIVLNIHKYPYQTNTITQLQQNRPQNIAAFSDIMPTKTYLPQQPISINKINFNANPVLNPYYPQQWSYLQNNPYKLAQNRPYFLNYNNNQYPLVSGLRPSNNIQYGKRFFQVPGMKAQNSVYMMQKYFNQHNPNIIVGQNLMQQVVPQYKGYNVNLLNKPPQTYAYGTRYFPFTQNSLSYNSDQSVIDKLVNWTSGTNFVKLDSNSESEAEIELTYRVKRPPLYKPAVFVKFRMPYQKFANHLSDFLNLQNPKSSSPGIDLYKNLAAQYKATVVPTDMKEISEEDIKSPEGKVLVAARYIQPNELGNENTNYVDIVNLEQNNGK